MRIASCRFLALAWTVLLAGLLAGCQGVPGSGVARSERRQLPSFTALDLSGGWELDLTVGEAKQSVSLSGDDNLLPLIKSEVRDKRLSVSERKPLRPKLPLHLSITVPSLERLEISGAASGQARGFAGGSLVLEISGAARLALRGKLERLSIEASGAGAIDAGQLIAEEVAVALSGAGKAEVHATRALRAVVSGAGSVRYRGNPSDVQREVSGAGSIDPL